MELLPLLTVSLGEILLFNFYSYYLEVAQYCYNFYLGFYDIVSHQIVL